MESLLNGLSHSVSFVIPFIVLLGILIFVHELGHFSVAKFFGVRVEVFSLGFGRKIFQRKVGDTVYCVSMIPMGGYVKMFGDDASAKVSPEEEKYSFSHQRVLPRIAIVLAGPLMNAIFAFFLFVIIAGFGEVVLKPQVGDIYPESAAYLTGFRSGDLVKRVNGEAVDRWETFKKLIEDSQGKSLEVDVERAGKTVSFQATPKVVPSTDVMSSKPMVGDIEGLTFISRPAAIGVSDPLSNAAQAGLKTGDIIAKVNGHEISKWSELEAAIKQSGETAVLEVQREGASAPLAINLALAHTKDRLDLEPCDLFIAKVYDKSPAQLSGLEAGDRLLTINGTELKHWEDVSKIVRAYKAGSPALTIEFTRSGHTHSAQVTPHEVTQPDPTGNDEKIFVLGVDSVAGKIPVTPSTFVAREKNPLVMVWKGAVETWRWNKMIAVSFVKLFQGKVSAKSIGGPLMIGKLAGDTWRIGVTPFLKIMALISINLFLLNLLPIPVLDGGHLLLFSIEFVKGSPLSFRKIEILQQLGMALLLALMVFSMFNDLVRFFS